MEAFRGVVISKQLFSHDDTSLSRLLFFFPRFSAVDSRFVWMLIKDNIKQLCTNTPTDLRMGVPAPTTNFVGLSATLTKTQGKSAIYPPYQSRQAARTLEEWLEMQPQRFVMQGINADSYNGAVWTTSSKFS
jgi:hypothetical protein